MTLQPDFSDLIRKFSVKKIMVIGDVMLDHYIWGDVHRISPEAPVPVVHAERDTYTAGGAANVALNLANLHIETHLVGYCGQDEAGSRLRHTFNEHSIHFHQPATKQNAPTIIKTRVIVRNQQLCRIDREGNQEAYRLKNEENFTFTFQALLAGMDAIIVSDYAKGVISQILLNELHDYATNAGNILLALDPKPSRRLQFKKTGLLTPNKNEALQLADLPEPLPGMAYPLAEVCRRIHERYEPNQLVVTLGADGMAVSSGGDVIQHLPTQAKEVYDVSGAGDTVIATLTAALVSGASIIQAAQLANMAAACVVSHVGTVPVTFAELSDKITAFRY
jgi:D-glycero-beta-D-manno-heptose-7-phosphate kinase